MNPKDTKKSTKSEPSEVNDSLIPKYEEKIFSNGFGIVRIITTQEEMPVYATYELCMYYWDT